MPRFTKDNTEGYTYAQLTLLNIQYDAAIEAGIAGLAADDLDDSKSLRDYIAERVLAWFDGRIEFEDVRHLDHAFQRRLHATGQFEPRAKA